MTAAGTTGPADVVCPGCGLVMPRRESAVYEGYIHASPECWSLFSEVVGLEFSDAVLFGQVHQLTVDAYAVQHAGGRHPDKSVDVHLSGLHLVLVQGVKPPRVAPLLQRIAQRVEHWPHLPPPRAEIGLTVCDVALAANPVEHAEIVRRWAAAVWAAWEAHHEAVGRLVTEHL